MRNPLGTSGNSLAIAERLATALAGVSFGVMLMLLFQLGVFKAFMEMVIRPIRAMNGELLIISRNYESSTPLNDFPSVAFTGGAADKAVSAEFAVVIAFLNWRNPVTGINRELVMFGIQPGKNPFTIPRDCLANGRANSEGLLFDEQSSDDYGPVAEWFGRRAHGAVKSMKRVQVQGLFSMGQTLTSSGHLVAGWETFLRVSGDSTASVQSGRR